MKKLSLALSVALAFAGLTAPAKANPLLGKADRSTVDEALAVGLDMMLQNTSLLRNGDNLLIRMRQGFQMAEVNPELVRRIERQYSANPAGLKRSMARSQKYLFYIMNEVERRGMPTELALLPVVESAFVPTARSHVGAAGLWQFMPATGRQYGLEQTWWYDGRRDVVEATNAALDYLQNLYGMFGDWSLALASYNWGEGNVSRAIARARAQGLEPTYENLKLPNETRNYVPKLLAVRNVIAEPEKFNVALGEFPNKPYFVAISTGRHMDIDVAARLAEMSVAEFKELNPAFNLPVYAYKNGRQMLLPADRLHRFERNIAKWDKPLMSWEVHVPQSDADAESIANQFNMDSGELRKVNNLRGSTFGAGQPVLVAARNSKAEPITLRVANERRTSTLEVPMLATVDSRELASRTPSLPVASPAIPPAILVAEAKPVPAIMPAARETRAMAPVPTPPVLAVITTPRVATATAPVAPPPQTGNPLDFANPQTVSTPANTGIAENTPALTQPVPLAPSPTVLAVASAQRAPLTQAGEHTVASGDTLYNISRRYGLSVPHLQALNGLSDNTVQLGQRLKVSGSPILATAVPANQDALAQLATLGQDKRSKPGEYIVQTGDTVFGIARKLGIQHSDLQRWNDAARLATLQPGQRLLIQGL